MVFTLLWTMAPFMPCCCTGAHGNGTGLTGQSPGDSWLQRANAPSTKAESAWSTLPLESISSFSSRKVSPPAEQWPSTWSGGLPAVTSLTMWRPPGCRPPPPLTGTSFVDSRWRISRAGGGTMILIHPKQNFGARRHEITPSFQSETSQPVRNIWSPRRRK